MKKYKVIANDEAMKYQVIDAIKEVQTPALYENDGEYEATEICDLMNLAYEEGKKNPSNCEGVES